jgi:N-acylglucosamine-6-phosphate 2-epimerase
VESAILEKIKNGLIVSCQAPAQSPLSGKGLMAVMAEAAEAGGAAAIRAEGIADIKSIKSAVSIPVIGLIKKIQPGTSVIITESIQNVKDLIDAGADMVAVDATLRKRLDGTLGPEFIEKIKVLGIPIMADVDEMASALSAAKAGADCVSTTLAGYTIEMTPELPDIDLVSQCAVQINVPIIAEGRFSTPQQVAQAFDAGAWSVCVGGAITDPYLSTIRFVTNMHR